MEFTSVAIPQTSWMGLQSFLSGQGYAGAEEDLRDRGFLDGEELSEAARIMLEGYMQAAGEVQLLLSEAGTIREALMWVNGDRVSTIVQSDEESVILRRAEPGTLPLLIIELLQFGPRPAATLTTPVTLSSDIVFGLLDGRGKEKSEELAGLVGATSPELREALLDNNWRCWMLQSFNVENEEPVRRDSIFVLDTSAGLFGLDFNDDQTSLIPISSADAWVGMIGVFTPAT